MSRLVAVVALLSLFANSARADHPLEWLKYLEGSWSYVESQDGESNEGLLKNKLVSNGHVVVAEFMSADGPSVEILGYRPESKQLVSNGYGPNGAYYQHNFTDITADKATGTTRGVSADGTSYEGTVTVEKKSPDQFQWMISSTSAAGKKVQAKGMVTRRAEASEAAQEWFKYFEGNWKYEDSVDGESSSGTAEYMSEGPGMMLVRFKSDAGSSTEILGWKSDEQILSVAGHALSNVGYWRHELSVTPDFAVGPSRGVLGDGRKYEGTITVKKFDADHWEWRFKVKTDDGQEVVGVGKFTRQ